MNYLTDVWKLETESQDIASESLSIICEEALNGSKPAISYLIDIWDGEEWESIKSKLQTEGSDWYVWWMDGVNNHLANVESNE